jgi:hypothetical protein
MSQVGFALSRDDKRRDFGKFRAGPTWFLRVVEIGETGREDAEHLVYVYKCLCNAKIRSCGSKKQRGTEAIFIHC